MSDPPTLDPDHESLDTVRECWFYTTVRVQNEPHAAAFVAPLLAFGPTWDTVAAKQQSLRDAIILAEAGAVAADRVLDVVHDRVSSAIHGGKKMDASHPLHKLYFGTETTSDAKRPVLGPELKRAKSWPALLSQAEQPELLALAPEANVAVTQAFAAQDALDKARADNTKFRLDGERRELFDIYNGLMATTYGGLKAVAHDHPEYKLSSDWAGSFFRRLRRSHGPQTVAQADVLVQKLSDQLEAAQVRKAELEAEVKAAIIKAQAQAEAEAVLAAAKQVADEAKKKEKEAAAAAKKAKKGK